MSEIGLQGARIVALIGQCIAAGVPKHVRMRLEIQLSLDPGALDHAGKASRGEGRAALRREYERGPWLLLALKPT